MTDTAKLTWEEKVKLAKLRCVPGSKWRNLRSGIVAEIVSFNGIDATFRRSKGKDTRKWINHLAADYEYLGGPND